MKNKKKKEIDYKPSYNGLSYSKYHKPTNNQILTKKVICAIAEVMTDKMYGTSQQN